MSKNLLTTLLIVVTFSMYYLVIRPLYSGVGSIWQPEKSIQSLKTLNKEHDTALLQAEDLASKAKNLEDAYKKVSSSDKEKMAVMVPSSIDKVRLISEIHTVASGIGVSLGEISYSETTLQSKGTAVVTFTVKTTYEKFKELLDLYEKSLRLLAVKGVTFTTPEKAGDPVTYQVRLETYFMK